MPADSASRDAGTGASAGAGAGAAASPTGLFDVSITEDDLRGAVARSRTDMLDETGRTELAARATANLIMCDLILMVPLALFSHVTVSSGHQGVAESKSWVADFAGAIVVVLLVSLAMTVLLPACASQSMLRRRPGTVLAAMGFPLLMFETFSAIMMPQAYFYFTVIVAMVPKIAAVARLQTAQGMVSARRTAVAATCAAVPAVVLGVVLTLTLPDESHWEHIVGLISIIIAGAVGVAQSWQVTVVTLSATRHGSRDFVPPIGPDEALVITARAVVGPIQRATCYTLVDEN